MSRAIAGRMNKIAILGLSFLTVGSWAPATISQTESTERAPTLLEQAMKTAREMLKENEEYSIWITTIVPNQPLAFHRHDQSRIVVPLTDTKLTKIFEDPNRPGERDFSREPVMMDWKRGMAYRFDADPAGEKHGDINETDQPIQVLVITFKKGPVADASALVNQNTDKPKYKYGVHD